VTLQKDNGYCEELIILVLCCYKHVSLPSLHIQSVALCLMTSGQKTNVKPHIHTKRILNRALIDWHECLLTVSDQEASTKKRRSERQAHCLPTPPRALVWTKRPRHGEGGGGHQLQQLCSNLLVSPSATISCVARGSSLTQGWRGGSRKRVGARMKCF
jgi:hypothetical protein